MKPLALIYDADNQIISTNEMRRANSLLSIVEILWVNTLTANPREVFKPTKRI